MALMLETPPRAAALPVQNLVDSLSRSGKAKHAPTEFNEELMAQRAECQIDCMPTYRSASDYSTAPTTPTTARAHSRSPEVEQWGHAKPHAPASWEPAVQARTPRGASHGFHGQGTKEEEALWRVPGIDEREVLERLQEQRGRKGKELVLAKEQGKATRQLRALARERRELLQAPVPGVQALRDADESERMLLEQEHLLEGHVQQVAQEQAVLVREAVVAQEQEGLVREAVAQEQEGLVREAVAGLHRAVRWWNQDEKAARARLAPLKAELARLGISAAPLFLLQNKPPQLSRASNVKKCQALVGEILRLVREYQRVLSEMHSRQAALNQSRQATLNQRRLGRGVASLQRRRALRTTHQAKADFGEARLSQARATLESEKALLEAGCAHEDNELALLHARLEALTAPPPPPPSSTALTSTTAPSLPPRSPPSATIAAPSVPAWGGHDTGRAGYGAGYDTGRDQATPLAKAPSPVKSYSQGQLLGAYEASDPRAATGGGAEGVCRGLLLATPPEGRTEVVPPLPKRTPRAHLPPHPTLPTVLEASPTPRASQLSRDMLLRGGASKITFTVLRVRKEDGGVGGGGGGSESEGEVGGAFGITGGVAWGEEEVGEWEGGEEGGGDDSVISC
ncbi:hypothetical protein T484DRAFT_1885033 [Baffinella frigidus]|nr:hypothetical protein T484DRAFT_1885033 [Cryptophyta sp. CCMP2293]